MIENRRGTTTTTIRIKDNSCDQVDGLNVKEKLMLKQYVVVAGVEYPGHKNNYRLSDLFSAFASQHIVNILSTVNKQEVINIINIDIYKGKITTTRYVGGTKENENIKQYDKLKMEVNYKNKYPYFDFNGKNIINKNDIYDIIGNIESEEPDTLMEFNIFSHAYYQGPILVDSVDPINDPANDNDLRITDLARLSSNTKKAFHANGFIKIWGCNFSPVQNQFLSRLRKGNGLQENIITDDTKIIYPPNHFWNQENVDKINNVFRRSYNINDKIELYYLELKKYLCSLIKTSYAGCFAARFDVKVIAALPITYTEFVGSKMIISPDTLSNVAFYKKLLDIETEENFGVYTKELINRLDLIYSSTI